MILAAGPPGEGKQQAKEEEQPTCCRHLQQIMIKYRREGEEVELRQEQQQ